MIGSFSLGFAASGFFDGILLHLILQWHHLLSSIQIGILGSLRGQVIFDGAFHAVMYVVGLIGLWMLYKSMRQVSLSAISQRLYAMFWTGFGTWHFADAIVSHWIAGIHRVRMDVSNPLIWDIVWLLLFGVIPVLAAWWIARRSPTTIHPGKILGSCVVVATISAGALNVLPVQGTNGNAVTIVLRPDRSLADVIAVMDQAGAGIVWADPAGAVWVLQADAGRLRVADLYRGGAMFVSSTLAGAACGSWFRI